MQEDEMTSLRETLELADGTYELTWYSRGALPPRELVTQVSAVCFTPDDLVVLVSADNCYWGIPGGHPEDGESLEVALRREVSEEACCDIVAMRLIGWQQVRDVSDGSVYYQLRYCCQVGVRGFLPEHEITRRLLVPPGQFLDTLGYGASPIARAMFALALTEICDLRDDGR